MRRLIDSRSSASGSDGCQVRPESALAKCITCCPVPLAISKTRPRLGRTRASTPRIGSLLRSAAGMDHFPSAVFWPRCLSIALVRLHARNGYRLGSYRVATAPEPTGELAGFGLVSSPHLAMSICSLLRLPSRVERDRDLQPK